MTKPKTPWPLSHCIDRVERKWGRNARTLLGETIYETCLDAELARLCDLQDESTDPASIVSILRDGRSQIIDHLNDK